MVLQVKKTTKIQPPGCFLPCTNKDGRVYEEKIPVGGGILSFFQLISVNQAINHPCTRERFTAGYTFQPDIPYQGKKGDDRHPTAHRQCFL